MFNIHLLKGDSINEDGSRLGQITVGDFVENFRCFPPETFGKMEASWKNELRNLVNGKDSILLIHDPRFAWVLYRIESSYFVQQRLFFDGNLDEIEPRELWTENGQRVREWETSIQSIREYLRE